jgi:hypothetical protein
MQRNQIPKPSTQELLLLRSSTLKTEPAGSSGKLGDTYHTARRLTTQDSNQSSRLSKQTIPNK